MVVNCTVDVRESFKAGIEALTPLVKRREDYNHGLLVDQYLPFNAGFKDVFIKSGTTLFPTGTFDEDTPCIVLELIGPEGSAAPDPEP